MNGLLNWLAKGVRHLMHVGLPVYSSARTYTTNDRCQDSGGSAWQRIGAGTTLAVAPGSDGTKWIRWGHSDGQIDTQIDDKIGTLSGVPSGIAASGGAVITNAQHFNMPGTTQKAIILTLAISQTLGMGATTITLSGSDTFATGALNAFAVATLSSNPSDIFQTAKVLTATTVYVSTGDNNTTPAATAHVCVIITGA